MAKLLASSSQPFPAFCLKHLSPPTPGQLQAASPSEGEAPSTLLRALDWRRGNPSKAGTQMACPRADTTVLGKGNAATVSSPWVWWGRGRLGEGITDLCPLAPLQRRVPRPRTPCSRPTRECSSMQVVSTRACPLLPQLCSSPLLPGHQGPPHPRPGLGTVWEGEGEVGRGWGAVVKGGRAILPEAPASGCHPPAGP